MTMTREQARQHINGRPLTDFVALKKSLKAGAGFYNCPVCGSGTGPNGTGAFKLYENNRVICYSKDCFTAKGEDTLGALRIIWNCDEAEVFNRAGLVVDSSPATKHQENIPHKEQQKNKIYTINKKQEDYSSFYREAHEALLKSPEALEYLHGRGITDESIKRFNLGYCADWKHSATLENEKKYNKVFSGTKRIIIPRTKGTYLARRIDKPQSEAEAQYVKQIQGRQKDLFNLEALEAGETPWIVEGELDAISIYQAGATSVIGIGADSNSGEMLKEAKKHPDKVYILALDNDPAKENGSKPGQDTQKKLAEDMEAAGLHVFSLDTQVLYFGEKDGNEAFVKHREQLKALVAVYEQEAQAMRAEMLKTQREELDNRTGPGMLDNFLDTVQGREFEPIPTGIPDIDRATAGGLTRRTLVLLSGAPGLGKTALAQLITENIAKGGRDVLYINLEMDRNQLLARSLARIAWTEEKADISPLDIMRGYSWTDEQREQIGKAAEKYRADIAPRFIYNPDGVTNELDSILQVMGSETMRIKAQGRPAPIVCIDYLQLVDAGERDAVEGLKQAIYRLKTFAKEEDTIVIAISATNRASNKTGTVDLESARDTSSIEYSGDMVLGLSYTAIEDRRKVTYYYEDEYGNEHESKPEECTLETIRRIRRYASDKGQPTPSICNEISLKILKNRFGEPERRAKLHFDGRHNLYTMAAHDFQIVNSKDTWENIIK